MGCFQPWVLASFPYGDQLPLQQSRHIYQAFLCGAAEKGPAYMGRHRKIYFIIMFCIMVFNDCVVDEGFRYVVCGQSCPYFLFNIFGLICMEITQPYSIFELAKRSFYSPYADILEMPTIEFEKR